MSITHSLETLASEQKSNLELAQTLLNNLNSLKPPHVNNTILKYDGDRFRAVQTGYAHKFLTDDIHLAIEGDLTKHKDFILKTAQKEFEDYNFTNKSAGSVINIKTLLTTIMKYYGVDDVLVYPKYSNNSDFKQFLQSLNSSIEVELNKL